MSVTAPKGFIASGIHCGIKDSGDLDLALVAAEGKPADSAAVFTTNMLQAAPVLVSRANLKNSKQKTKAVILNSGCANAATGDQGLEAAEAMCAKTGEGLGVEPEEVLVCSTGLIGYQLPVEKIYSGIPSLLEQASGLGHNLAARAICTTDTQEKECSIDASGFSVGAMAKGAAMLSPQMATMLAVITTDAACKHPARDLKDILAQAADKSFNKLSVDGVQSTNDTVILLSSGKAGEQPKDAIAEAVTEACQNLACQMAGDAEGGTKTIQLYIEGAPSDALAEEAARYIVNSMLIKCSWYGGDPYWGRLASELGAVGIAVDLDRLSIKYGEHLAFKGNSEIQPDLSALSKYMSGPHLDVYLDLGLGSGRGYMLTCDLGHGYIDENSQTS